MFGKVAVDFIWFQAVNFLDHGVIGFVDQLLGEYELGSGEHSSVALFDAVWAVSFTLQFQLRAKGVYDADVPREIFVIRSFR